MSNNDAANIVQELFVCAAFRTNKSFGRSLSPSEELFESMNYILRLLWVSAKTGKLSIFVRVNDDDGELISLLIQHTGSGCFLNNWWNVKLWTLQSTPITQIAGRSSMNPCNWPEKLLFTRSLPGSKTRAIISGWLVCAVFVDRPTKPPPLPPPFRRVGANILVKQTSTNPLDQSVSALLWLNDHYHCPHHHYHDHRHPPLSVWWWHSCGFI